MIVFIPFYLAGLIKHQKNQYVVMLLYLAGFYIIFECLIDKVIYYLKIRISFYVFFMIKRPTSRLSQLPLLQGYPGSLIT